VSEFIYAGIEGIWRCVECHAIRLLVDTAPSESSVQATCPMCQIRGRLSTAEKRAADARRAAIEDCAQIAELRFDYCQAHAPGTCPNPPQKWEAGQEIAAALRLLAAPCPTCDGGGKCADCETDDLLSPPRAELWMAFDDAVAALARLEKSRAGPRQSGRGEER